MSIVAALRRESRAEEKLRTATEHAVDLAGRASLPRSTFHMQQRAFRAALARDRAAVAHVAAVAAAALARARHSVSQPTRICTP